LTKYLQISHIKSGLPLLQLLPDVQKKGLWD
jgi:hypothetical protein